MCACVCACANDDHSLFLTLPWLWCRQDVRRSHLAWLALASALSLMLCSSVQQSAPASLLSRQHLEERPSTFFELNLELDLRQHQIDEARAQLLFSAFPSQNAEPKGVKQSLYMETDAAPSGAMLQEYWRDFTALPPSHRPGVRLSVCTSAYLRFCEPVRLCL